jgi:endonuclease G, mitochondrial
MADTNGAAGRDVGFDREFLRGKKLDLPQPGNGEVRSDLQATLAGDTTRHCTHFSLAMSKSRKLCRWVAWNISAADHDKTTVRNFKLDPEYDGDSQVGGDFYERNKLDQGHIAAFADVSWGAAREAERARDQSCYFTNITPQLDSFNRSNLKGIWGQLEAAIARENDVTDKRLSVFGGPAFAANDVLYHDILVPHDFWKVVAYVEDGVLKAKAFQMTQRNLEDELEELILEDYRMYQRRVDELAGELGLDLGPLVAADTAPVKALMEQAGPTVRSVASIEEISVSGW